MNDNERYRRNKKTKKEEKLSNSKPSFWVRDIFTRRQQHGEFCKS